MKESFTLTETFPVTPEVIYQAWLDSEGHTQMTGGEAECSAKIGAPFTAWDGYITGTNKSLSENTEIVQSWRTSEFKEEDEDSILTIRLKAVAAGCELTLIHTNLPKGQTQYLKGWEEHYFAPMQHYFKAG